MAQQTEKPGHDWFAKAEICAFQGISEQTFDRTYRQLVPPASVKKNGHRVWYHGPAYFEAVVAYKAQSAKPAPSPSDDPMLAGGDSPNLEEYRRHKARIAKVEADEREKLVARLSALRPPWMSAMGLIRRAGEQLERQYGRDAAVILIEAVDEAKTTVEKALATYDEPGIEVLARDAGTGEATAPAVDA